MAFTNCLANLTGLLAPVAAGYIIEGRVSTRSYWLHIWCLRKDFLGDFNCYICVTYSRTHRNIFVQQPTQAQWKKVFYIAGGIYIFCGTFYNVFASGKRQDWDNPADDEANAKIAADKRAIKEEKKAAKIQREAETAQ